MRYAIFTVSLPDYTPEEAVKEMKSAGYDGVEWRVTEQSATADGKPSFWAGNRCTVSLNNFAAEAPRIRSLAEQAGLAMPNVGTYVNCANVKEVEIAMQGAAKLGASQLRINVPGYNSRDSYLRQRDQAIAQYRDVADLAKQYGLRALIEIHMGTLTPSASAAAAFVQHFDPRYVGIIHDAGNMVYEGYEQYRLGLEVLGPYLAHVHMKNACWQPNGAREDGSTKWQAVAAPISKGIVDVHELFRALRQVGYDGWIAFEDFSTEQPLAERIRANLSYIKQVEQQVKVE